MESAQALKKDMRHEALKQWLHQECGLRSYTLQPMPSDASFRRYYRLQLATGTLVVMDAIPPQENCHAYVVIAKALRRMELAAPEIIQSNLEQGFLLITDFGDATYLKTLNEQNADQLYSRALQTLFVLQGCRTLGNWRIPPFTQEFMWQEWQWHKEWFVGKLLNQSCGQFEKQLDHCVRLLVDAIAEQPVVFMHRDYHSANLMVLPNAHVGILDFQDAFWGPVTYDVASLLRDCYINWPEARVHAWVKEYWSQLRTCPSFKQVSQETFIRWFDWMSLQRHLKALFTFARKQVRDQQSRYLQYVPRTLNYLLHVSQQYPELAPLCDYLHETIMPSFEREWLTCVP